MNAPNASWPAIKTPAMHFIGNAWRAPAQGGTLPMIDPSDGAPFTEIARGTAEDVDAAVRCAQDARAGAWGRLAPAERGRALMAISQAKLFGSEAYANIANQGMQIMGGYGYIMEFDMQRHYRDARATTITAGTSQMQRNLIAGLMGLKTK